MKKSKLQVLIEFVSFVSKIKTTKKPVNKTFNSLKKHIGAGALLILVTAFSLESFGTTYYSKANGNWNSSASWSTVGYGNAINTGTFPAAGDVANIGDGYTINVIVSAAASTINIGQGVSGRLSFVAISGISITVTGNITLNTGATLNDASIINATKGVIVGGNFTNFGTVDLYVSATRHANLTFSGAGNSIVSGNGSWDLNFVTLNKTTVAQTVDVQSNAFETANRRLIPTRGTYNHNNAGTYSVIGSSVNYTIGPNSCFRVPAGTMNFSSLGSQLSLQGALYVNGGNVTVGSMTSTIGIATYQTSASVVPYLEVTSGSLDVRAGISFTQGVATPGPFSFRMTGGTVTVNTGTSGSIRNLFYVNDVAGSVFNMTGGTMILQRPNVTSINVVDFSICGNNGTVTSTGGTIQFGNASTPAASRFSFTPFASVTQPHFRVTGNIASAVSLAPSNGNTNNFRLLSLFIDFGKTFDMRSINGVFGDNRQMTLMNTWDGINAFYNNGTFLARTSTVTFNTSGAQSLGGANVTTFYNLSINNANGITLNRAENVQNFLSLVNGVLYTTNANVLTIQSNGSSSIGANNTYVDGPMVHTVATASSITKTYPVGKNGSYRPVVLTVQHTNSTSVTYRAEIFNSPASGLPYTLPPTIANVSNIRYVQFTRQPIANFFRGTIQMYYDTDDGVLDHNSLLVAHDDGSSQWQNFGGTATADITGNITSSTFTNFNSFFALGNPPGGNNPLPVELTSFNAKLVNKNTFVDWNTASEINNDYFILERSSDNVHFTELVKIEGNGTTSKSHYYSFTDTKPLTGISYYRLKQVDFDGKSTTFKTVAIYNTLKENFEVYPNPSNGKDIWLSFQNNLQNDYEITVQDITGKVIPSHTESSGFNENLKLVLDVKIKSNDGLYFVTARSSEKIFTQRLLISNK